MCLGFFQLIKHKKKKSPEPNFTRLTSDYTIKIHEDEDYFPSSPLSTESSTAADFSLALPNPSNVSPQLKRGYPKPLPFYNKQQNKHYIVITTSYRHTNKSTNNGCVYLYDVSQNTYTCIPYPIDLKPEYHGHCINNDSGMLYIFFGRYGIFATLNLYTNNWAVKCANNESVYDMYKYNIQNMWYPMSYYIPLPINEIHVFGERVDGNGNGSHFKYDNFANIFKICSENRNQVCDLEEVQVCYIEHRKQLFVLNGDIDGRKTCCLDFNNSPKWELLDIEKNSGDCVVLFDRLILIVRGESIWCLDLAANEFVWIESEFKLSGLLMQDTNVIKVTDFYLHFMNMVYANHTQLWFYCVLPFQIRCQFNNIIALWYAKQCDASKVPTNVIGIIESYINLL